MSERFESRLGVAQELKRYRALGYRTQHDVRDFWNRFLPMSHYKKFFHFESIAQAGDIAAVQVNSILKKLYSPQFQIRIGEHLKTLPANKPFASRIDKGLSELRAHFKDESND
jgi:hypothetical protein